jgi:phage-related protein
MKRIFFLADTLAQIKDFPLDVRREVGAELRRVQQGVEPNNWKPMKTVGPACREIRVRDESGAYRIIYVLLDASGVYVLNAFQKKSQKTPTPEIELASRRLKQI